MKKEYQKPESLIFAVECGTMMTASITGNKGDGTTTGFGDPTTKTEYGNAKELGGSIWDDYK